MGWCLDFAIHFKDQSVFWVRRYLVGISQAFIRNSTCYISRTVRVQENHLSIRVDGSHYYITLTPSVLLRQKISAAVPLLHRKVSLVVLLRKSCAVDKTKPY
jgi:hypothetical protein